MNFLHDNPHPSRTLVDFSGFDHVGVREQGDDLDLVSQEFLLFHCELSFVYLFEGVSNVGSFVFSFENIRKFAAS